MVEGTFALKKIVEWTEESKHKRQYEGKSGSYFWYAISSGIGSS
jgi:hypothetical protein